MHGMIGAVYSGAWGVVMMHIVVGAKKIGCGAIDACSGVTNHAKHHSVSSVPVSIDILHGMYTLLQIVTRR